MLPRRPRLAQSSRVPIKCWALSPGMIKIMPVHMQRSIGLAWLDLPEANAFTRARALILRARIGIERRDLAMAIKALDGVDHEGALSGEFAYWKGRTLYEARQPLLALGWFRTARKLKPDDADAARWLAAAAYDLGDRSTVVEALEGVARLDPKDPRVWRTLGAIFLENVKYEQARTAFERSLALDRSQQEVRLQLAETLLKLGEAEAAKRELDRCEGMVSREKHAELLSESFRIKGDIEGLRKVVAVGLAEAPENPALLTQQATIDLADGQEDLALIKLDRAAKADPYRSQTFYQRGLVLRRLGREADAALDNERAASLAKSLVEMSTLNDQAAQNPQDPEVRYQLGLVCIKLGKPELAASWLRAALACDPKHESARKQLSALNHL